MSRIKKMLIVTFSALFLVCAALFVAACETGSDDDETYTVTIASYETSQGSVAKSVPANGTAYTKNEAVTITVSPSAGYAVLDVKVNGEIVALEDNNTYTFNIVQDTTVAVIFYSTEVQKHNISFTVEGNENDVAGAAEISQQGEVAHGQTITVTVTANEGYVATVHVNGNLVSLSRNEYVFILNEDAAIVVAFAVRTHTVTMRVHGNSDNAAGTTDVDKTGEQLYGTLVTVTVHVNDGYTATVHINGNEVTLTENKYTFTLEEDTDIVVIFIVSGFDDAWTATTIYAASAAGSTAVTKGVEVSGGASILNKRQNNLNYYPIGNQVTGSTIVYHIYSTEDATVGLYAEFGYRPNPHIFNDIYLLTVNGETVDSFATMPSGGTEFESSNTFLFLAAIELKADVENEIVMKLIDNTGDGYGYNFYAYRFTAETAKISADKKRSTEIIDTGYGVKYAGEERVTISGNTPYIIQKSSIRNDAWKSWTRLYANNQSTNSYFILKIDRSDLADVSKVGLVVNQIFGRGGAVLYYSTDNSTWTEFAKKSAGTLGGSFHYEIQSGFDWYWFADGKEDVFSGDDGPHTCFYEIGKYFGSSKVLYIKAGNTVEGDKAGCDWLASFSILDYLEVDQEVASGSLATASIPTGFVFEGKRFDVALPEKTTF